jgi:hypothetical protein
LASLAMSAETMSRGERASSGGAATDEEVRMKLLRPATCLVLAASLAAAGTASAATKAKPKPVCNLITDPTDDSSFLPGMPDQSMEITSADISSSAKVITAVIRVKDLAASSNAAYLGRNFYFRWNAPEAEYPLFVSASTDAVDGDTFSYGRYGVTADGVEQDGLYGGLGDAQGVIDRAHNLIRISVPTSVMSDFGKVKVGSKFTGLYTGALALIGVPGVGGALQTVDEAEGSKSYVAGALSCVKP